MTDHTVEELEAMLEAAKAKAAHQEYPKWVEPHASHVVTAATGHKSVPSFSDHHTDQNTGKLMALVHSAEEEAKALAEAVIGEHA